MALDDDPLWYKDAIIYEAHVKSFFDSTNDGIGDFRGLTSKLDYLQDLGITCLWILPFYPSPLKDDGYDISNYTDVHASYGTLDDFRAFVEESHRRGIRVLIELVVNHTSDQHPWFQRARQAPRGSRERDFYVWSDTDQKFPETRIIFTDTEKSNWTYDPVAGQYYWHRFFSHQPDLNHDNPEVVDAVIGVMKFWLDLGVDALRLDAVPYLCVREGTSNENLPETHEVLKRIRRELDAQYSGRMLLAEANQWPADVRPYFGDGDECHMAFHFPLMPRMFMAVRQEDRHPIAEILRQTPEIPPTCQWALFLRNHDELTLEMVTDEERDYMYGVYATDPLMRLNVGIRRRLAPLLENNRLRVELMNVLLFTLPGTPVVYYGDEIGMGDNIYLGDRNGVRTPMQWNGDRNAGFSRADPAQLFAPVIMDPVYGYQSINVESQERYPFSLLHFMKRLIALRKNHRVLGRGVLEFVDCSNRKVLAYVRRDSDETLLIVASLSRYPQAGTVDLKPFAGLVPVEVLGETDFPRIDETPYSFTLGGYGFYVFRLAHAVAPVTARVLAPEPAVEPAEALPGLLAGVAWDTLLDGGLRRYLEREALAGFLRRQHWVTAAALDGVPLTSARFVEWGTLRAGSLPVFLTIVEGTFGDGTTARFFLPLATVAGSEAERLARQAPAAVVARITGARKGLLVDAAWDDHACGLLLDSIVHGRQTRVQDGIIVAGRSENWIPDEPDQLQPLERSGPEQTNTLVAFGPRKMLKLYRRLDEGLNPEFEIGQHFDRVGFDRVPPLAGWMEHRRDGRVATTAVLHGRVRNQGNAWSRMLDDLGQYYERGGVATAPPLASLPDLVLRQIVDRELPEDALVGLGVPLPLIRTLGQRTAQMHLALADARGDARFAPEPFLGADVESLIPVVIDEAAVALDAVQEAFDTLPEQVRERAEDVLSRRDALVQRLKQMHFSGSLGRRIRCHGDFHLAQLLWTEQDFIIIDFEGDPARSLAERRQKESPVMDVASMVRSFSYAAMAGLLTFMRQRPDLEPVMTPWTTAWRRWTTGIFVRSYRDVMGPSGLVPGDTAEFMDLLDLFLVRRASSEIHIELRSRPEWLRIPLAGLSRLLDGGAAV
jgi:maltose alpha-D-glucosyltransferase / alpha-amylase